MKVTIVIPNYNGKNLLKKNLSSVFSSLEYYSKKTGGKGEVIIVDDKSTDTSVEYIHSLTSKVRLFVNGRNYGFSSTANQGVREAYGEIVVLLNTDVKPEEDFLIPLLDHFKDEDVFAVGCLDKSVEGEKIVERGRGIGIWKKGLLVHSAGSIDKTNTLWVSGGSSAFRKSIWNKLGGFDTLYNPFYYEDIDLSYRALKSGYKVLFEPQAVVTHSHEEGSIKKNYSKSNVKVIAYRNQFIFAWKNATDSILIFSCWFWLPYHFLSAFKRKDKEFLIGLAAAVRRFIPLYLSRRRAKKFFVKRDSEVIIQNES